MRYSKFFLYLLKIIIMKKGLLFGLMLCSSLFFSQESINTDGFSTEKRHQFYINFYEKLLREEFFSKMEKINAPITEKETQTLFERFKKNLPIKKYSQTEKENLGTDIFRKERIYNITGLKSSLQEFYGLDKAFSFSINKYENNTLSVRIANGVYKTDAKVLEL